MGDSGCDIIRLTSSHVTTLTTRRPPLPREEGMREVSPFKECDQSCTRPPTIRENLSNNAREHANTPHTHSIDPMWRVPKHKSVSNKQMSCKTQRSFSKHKREFQNALQQSTVTSLRVVVVCAFVFAIICKYCKTQRRVSKCKREF